MAVDSLDRVRRVSLATALATALGIGAAPSSALAANWPVGRCSDTVGKGGDTLRTAVTKAGSGDTVDLTTLPATCTGFTLTGGAIIVGKTDLSIAADRNIVVDGGNVDRVFNHIGFGTLYLRYLTLTHGNEVSGNGGCVASYGKVTLSHTTITACQASGSGGGVYAASCQANYSSIDGNLAPDAAGLHCTGNALFIHSTVSGNLVGGGVRAASLQSYYSTFANNTNDSGSGGGIYTSGAATLVSSIVSGNSTSAANSDGGGIRSGGNVTVQGSLIVSNSAHRFGGGVSSSETASLTDTTVSGNQAADGGGARAFTVHLLRTTVDTNTAASGAGGVDSTNATITSSTISGNQGASPAGLYGFQIIANNSTIAFNHANATTAGSVGGLRGSDMTMSSTIVANNSTAGPDAADIFLAHDPSAFQPTNSLIMSCNCSTLSITTDPRLAPLAFHGGAQRTHALSSGSPAIDVGSAGDQPTDERGSGYPRVAGAAADIGAYERQLVDDEIFYSGME